MAGLNSLGLGFVFTATDLASGTMTKIQGKFAKLDSTTAAASKSMGHHMGTMVAGMAVMAAGAVGVGTAFKLAGKYGTFEKGIAKVGAISRASAGDLELLRERAMQAGIDTQFSPDEANEGLAELAVRGFNAKQSMEALGGALDLAAGGDISVAQASSSTAAALRVFQKDASFATEAADKLLKISNITALQANDLEVALGSIASGAILGKQGMDEMLISVGLVRNSGAEASKSANAVSSAMKFMGKNGDKFKDIGVALDDADGNMKNFLDIVLEADVALNKLGLKGSEKMKKQVEMFGRFGALGFGATIAQLTNGIQNLAGETLHGADAVKYLRDEMATAAGTAAKFREQLLATFEGQKQLLKGSMQTLSIALGEAFAKSLKPIVTGIVFIVNAMIKVIKNIPGPIKKILAIGFLVVSMFVLIAGAAIAAVGAFALIKMAVIAFAAPLIVMAKVMAVAVLAALALTAVFAVLKLAYDRNIGGFGDKLRAIAGKVKLFFDAVAQLTGGDGRLRGDVLAKLLDPANKGILTMVQRFQQLRGRIAAFLSGLKEGFTGVMETAGPTFSALGDAMTEFMAALGFSSKGMGLMTSKSSDWRDIGNSIGEVVGDLTRLFMHGLTVAIRLATGAMETLSVAWSIFKGIATVVIYATWAIVKVFGAILRVFTDVGEASNKTGGNFDHLHKILGWGLGVWAAVKLAVYGAKVAMLAYRGAVMAVTLAQKAYSLGAAGMRVATKHPLLAAAALGFTIGTLADEYWDLSGSMANYLVGLTEEGKEVAKLDKAYRTIIKTRGQIAVFDSLESAAKASGMNVNEYADKKATKLAGESWAKERGLSKEGIKKRLMAGEDVFTGTALSKPVTASEGAEGVRTAKNGEADQAKAAVQGQADAIADGLARAEKNSKPVKFEANFNVDKQRMATIVKEGNMETDALDFEADFAL